MRPIRVPLHSRIRENQLIKHSESGDKHFASTNSHHFLQSLQPHLGPVEYQRCPRQKQLGDV